MKKVYILTAITLFLINACSFVELEENPPSLLSPESFFTTESEFQAALAGTFRPLYSDWESYDYAYPLILNSGAEDIRSDADIYIDLNVLNAKGTELPITGMWKQLYRSISNANVIIGNLQNAQGISEESLGAIEGQAKFIRAFCFFNLTRWFGEVQLTTFENQENAGELKQSTVSEIYDTIIQDLQDAEEILPVSFPERGRPTKGAAKALLAKVYLTMAGWPLEQTDKFALARDKAAELISGELSGIYSLESDFSDLWKVENKLTNSEIIFGFYGTTAPGGTGSHMHTASRHWGNGEGGWGDLYSEDRFYEIFPEGPRKDATFTSYFADGTYWEDADVQPHMAKYRDAGIPVGHNGEGFTVILRYADVLLMFAEAANKAESSPSSQAIEAVNRVRRRAMGLDVNSPNGDVDLPPTISFEEFDQAVLEERNWELAFENNRWFDLVRRKMVVEVNKDVHPNVTENNRLLPKPIAELIPGVLDQNEGY
ncbi:MAG: RagB/SusD family nutrient uptake outer membrane protein [Cytophagales bacterium]|nr:RagB/SusD family nutrient uptake outer membrane protein [Cytophagales bacterium]